MYVMYVTLVIYVMYVMYVLYEMYGMYVMYVVYVVKAWYVLHVLHAFQSNIVLPVRAVATTESSAAGQWTVSSRNGYGPMVSGQTTP